MTFVEIALLAVGVIIFVISFLLPEKEEKKTEKEIAAERELVQRIIDQEIDGMKLRINEVSNDTVDNAVDRAERSLEKVSNEKIMAVNEYSATILEEINKNHKEVMFLYDMLKDKQTELNNEVRKADSVIKNIGEMTVAAQNASETLLRGMGVATVSQKGLTAAQKAVFDDINIPDASPVVFNTPSVSTIPQEAPQVIPQPSAAMIPQVNIQNSNMVGTAAAVNNQTETKEKPRAVALAQSKIMASLNNDASIASSVERVQSQGVNESVNKTAEPIRKNIAYDLLSGGAYSGGNIINVNAPAKGAVTAADYAAMINNSSVSSQAPANNNDRILELSRQGLNTVEIAKTLNLGVGEVKLVLDLFK